MTYERWQYYERQQGFNQGIAQQKAEDEKLILAEREQNKKQANEIKRLQEEIAKLKENSKN